MSDLRRRLAGRGGALPGLPPRGPARGRGGGRVKSCAPIHWSRYWGAKVWVETVRGRFCTYRAGAGRGALLVLLHGGGYSALTWSLVTRELVQLTDARVLALDLRGHGETTVVGEEEDLSGDTLVEDVRAVLAAVGGGEGGGVVLVGHSMGGALAARVAAEGGVEGLAGLVVVDVVEGTALEALAGMQGVLR